MKTSTISNLSITNALRMTMTQTQKELVVAQAESVSGKHYDMGISLGAKTAQSLDLNREVDRLKALNTSNSLVTTRLGASQAALKDMAASGQEILNTVLAFGGNEASQSLATSKTSIQNYLNSIVEKANFSSNGEYLFSGINTDVKPLKDTALSSTSSFLQSELASFMTANGIASKSQITESQMSTFLSQVEATFTSDAYWKANISNASDTNTQSRITQGEVVQTSVNTNEQSMRKLVLGSAVALEFMDASLPPSARNAVQKFSQDKLYQGTNGITAMQGKLGLSEERVKKASDSLESQQTIITKYLGDLEGVDTVEVASRLKSLLSLVDASYTLTARIQQLSLVNFL